VRTNTTAAPNPEGKWQHDLFQGGAKGRGRAAAGGAVASGADSGRWLHDKFAGAALAATAQPVKAQVRRRLLTVTNWRAQRAF